MKKFIKSYNRYFRVTDGPLIIAVQECLEHNRESHKQYVEILKDLGAMPECYHHEGKLIALQFKRRPSSVKYKRMKSGGWYPRRNSKAGRELCTRIESINIKPMTDALEVIGLSGNPTVFARNREHCPDLTIKHSDPMVVLVSVPWFSENPRLVAEYAEEREAGTRSDANFDALLWEPSDDMVEIGQWAVKKEVYNWNKNLNSEEAGE